MAQRILVILGHPSADSLSAALAQSYKEGAQAAGAQVRLLDLGALAFDPILRAGYRGEQALEPDLQAAQAQITWAEHLVWVYPTWWGAMPALLKGFIDRVFLPGFAFKYRQGSSLWDRLLAGRLEFSGIRPVLVQSFGPVRTADAARRQRWLERARRLGEEAQRI